MVHLLSEASQARAPNWPALFRVLIDGRTVHSPMFAGVFWDTQNILIDSIERTEVIRGPGAASYGSLLFAICPTISALSDIT